MDNTMDASFDRRTREEGKEPERFDPRGAVADLGLYGAERSGEALDRIHEFLQRTPATKGLFGKVARGSKPEVIEALLRNVRLLTMARGTVLYRQLESGQSFYIILDGKCELFHRPVSKEDAETLRKVSAAGMHLDGAAVAADIGTKGGMLATMQRENMGSLVTRLSPGRCFGEYTAGPEGSSRPRQETVVAVGGATGTAMGVPANRNSTVLLQVDFAAFNACSRLAFRAKNMARNKRIDMLQPLHLFSSWPEMELEFLAHWMRDFKVPADKVIYDHGDDVEWVWFLTVGSVALTTRHPEHSEATVNLEHVVAPCMFGDTEVVAAGTGPEAATHIVYQHRATAVEDSVVLAAPMSVFRALVMSEAGEKALGTGSRLGDFALARIGWHEKRMRHAVKLTSDVRHGGKGEAGLAGLPVPFAFTDSTQVRAIPCSLCNRLKHFSSECPGPEGKDDDEGDDGAGSGAGLGGSRRRPSLPPGRAPTVDGSGADGGASAGAGAPSKALPKPAEDTRSGPPKRKVRKPVAGIRGRVSGVSLDTWKEEDYRRMFGDPVEGGGGGGGAEPSESKGGGGAEMFKAVTVFRAVTAFKAMLRGDSAAKALAAANQRLGQIQEGTELEKTLKGFVPMGAKSGGLKDRLARRAPRKSVPSLPARPDKALPEKPKRRSMVDRLRSDVGSGAGASGTRGESHRRILGSLDDSARIGASSASLSEGRRTYEPPGASSRRLEPVGASSRGHSRGASRPTSATRLAPLGGSNRGASASTRLRSNNGGLGDAGDVDIAGRAPHNNSLPDPVRGGSRPASRGLRPPSATTRARIQARAAAQAEAGGVDDSSRSAGGGGSGSGGPPLPRVRRPSNHMGGMTTGSATRMAARASFQRRTQHK